MIKFAHISDVHLGAKFLVFGDHADDLRSSIITNLNRLLDRLVSDHITLLLIAGDIFDGNDINEYQKNAFVSFLEKSNEQKINVAMIFGNHDELIYNELKPRIEVLSTVHVLENGSSVEFPDLNIKVFSDRTLSFSKNDNPLKYGALLLHGAYPDEFPIEKLRETGVDYVALGHFHGFKEYILNDNNGRIVYPGSFEMLEKEDKDFGNVVFGEFLDEGGVHILKERWTKYSVVSIDININDFKNFEDIIEHIKHFSSEFTVALISVNGSRDVTYFIPEEMEFTRRLNGMFFALSLDIQVEQSEDIEQLVQKNEFRKLLKKNIYDKGEISEEEKQDILEYCIKLLEGKENTL